MSANLDLNEASSAPARRGGDMRELAPGEYLDLGTCVNRYGPPPAVSELFTTIDVTSLRGHPYLAEPEFIAKYSKVLDVQSEHLIAGRGISDFIRLLSDILPKDDVAIIVPDYTDYIRLFPVHLTNDGGQVDTPETRLARIAGAMARYSFVIISNPNNPLGIYVDRLELIELCKKYPTCTLIVDEAFIEFMQNEDQISMVHTELNNLVVLRSPNKLFGLAGTRTGALWTRNASLVNALKERRHTWPISYLDGQVACSAMTEKDWALKTANTLLKDSLRLDRFLGDRFGTVLRGVPVHYRFVETSEPQKMYDLFLLNRVIVRPFFKEERGRIPGFRITTPTTEELDSIEERFVA